MRPDWNRLRRDFPITRRLTYLDHAAAGPLPRPVYEEVKRTYWDPVHYGDVHWAQWLKKRDVIRAKLARFINAAPEEITFVHNTSEGMNLVADLIAEQGKVLTDTLEFPSSTVPWLHRRVPVKFLGPEEGKILPAAVKRALTRDVKTIVMSYVQYQNGYRQDLAALGKMKGSRFLVVNATQALGVLPVDVRKWDADFLCAATYKWFLAGYGGGILFLKKKWLRKFRPSSAGWRSRKGEEVFDNRTVDLKEDASRYEYGCPALPIIFTLGAAVDYFNRIGVEHIEKRVLELTDYAVPRLQKLGLEITSPLERKYRSGIIVFKVPRPKDTVKALFKRRIFVSPRGEGIRLAPHFYNNFSDIDKLINNLRELV